MVYEFVPTLIQTIDWDAVTWDSLRFDLSDEFKRLAEEEAIDEIYSKIEWFFDEPDESQIKDRIRDFLDDYSHASGVVSAEDPLYQDVILAILETFS